MITFDRAGKRYPDGTVAVDELSLDCPTGEVTVLVGSSGSGKTTCLRMVNRMVEATSGAVRIDGVDVSTTPPAALRRGIGYVIQQGGLFPHRTVLDNVATVPLLLGWGRRRARLRAGELLERVGLAPELGRRYPVQLSGGQQQRVGVARALAADPPVLLMDEPFSAVDPVVRAELQDELLRLQAELGKTIVFVTHDIDEAIRIGDRIAVMRTGGRLVQVGPPEEILARPADDFVAGFVGLDRGVRRLSFFPAADLPVDPGPMVPLGAPVAAARAAADGCGWLLATDPDGRPAGWLAAADLPAAGSVAAELVRPLGHSFQPASDSLRAALDAAVLSPAGCAAAVDAAGRALGVVGQQAIHQAIRAANTAGGGRLAGDQR